MLSHDWPAGIYHHGNKRKLLLMKQDLRPEEVRKRLVWKQTMVPASMHVPQQLSNNTVGSPAAMELLQWSKPSYWFSGHLHVEFEAVYHHSHNRTHSSGSTLSSSLTTSSSKAEEEKASTNFFALDKPSSKGCALKVEIEIDYSKNFLHAYHSYHRARLYRGWSKRGVTFLFLHINLATPWPSPFLFGHTAIQMPEESWDAKHAVVYIFGCLMNITTQRGWQVTHFTPPWISPWVNKHIISQKPQESMQLLMCWVTKKLYALFTLVSWHLSTGGLWVETSLQTWVRCGMASYTQSNRIMDAVHTRRLVTATEVPALFCMAEYMLVAIPF